MEDPAAHPHNDGPPAVFIGLGFNVVEIVPDGDIVLDVTFDTSKEALKAARKATKPRSGQNLAQPSFKSTVRIGYRVRLSALKEHSNYFRNLLGDTRFKEATLIADKFAALSLQNVKPSEAAVGDLPFVKITEDDEATKSAGQETVFADLLKILHGKGVDTKPLTMQYLATLTVLADRFDCTASVSKALGGTLRFKWPVTLKPLPKEDSGPTLSKAAEETLRQKVLVAWLLSQPGKMQLATRELVMYGSRKWTSASDEDVEESAASWWDLPDGLERELQFRRDCILNAIASAPRHFLQIYTSRQRKRQCQLGYDSSSSCDSYQLGEMVRFLVSRNLLFLVDFSTHSLDNIRDYADIDILHILGVLKQCPSYQIDKNHTNCGLRTRVVPILDFIQVMLSSDVISISSARWRTSREATSWLPSENDDDKKKEEAVFRFTRSMTGDGRLRFEDALGADRMAKRLFTADRWDWTPEEDWGTSGETRGNIWGFGRGPAP